MLITIDLIYLVSAVAHPSIGDRRPIDRYQIISEEGYDNRDIEIKL